MQRRALWTIAIAILTVSRPAEAGFTKVDFRYTSLTHLNVSNSSAVSRLTPAATVDIMADFLRSQGAQIISIKENSVKVVQTQGDRDCELWSNKIFLEELSIFRAGSYKRYKKIDRSSMPAGCSSPKPTWVMYGHSRRALNSGEGFHMVAVLDRSFSMTSGVMRPKFSSIFSASGSAGVWSMTPSSIASNVNFETVLSIFVWREAGDKASNVFAFAFPRSGGIEAGPAASIGPAFLPYADGKIEAAAVGNLLSFVVQKSLVAP